jgi:uncharacterized membrane protein YfhO
LEATREPGFDPGTAVIGEAVEFSATPIGGPGRVLSFNRQFNRVEIEAEAPNGGYLVVSQPHYPTWRGTIDGQETTIFHADYLLQGVWLPAGNHRVVFTLEPTQLLRGGLITAATLIGLVCFLVGVVAGRWMRAEKDPA